MPPEGGKDRLLALYERGMILHAARRWEDSNAALLEAGKLAERIELISVAERSGTLFTNENFVDYRGEDYERVLCHTLSAINYLGLGKVEDALVECRRTLEVHKKIRRQREKDDRINAFALYLSALCYELGGQPNYAYIDYRACWEQVPSFPPLADRLLLLSKRLGMVQEHAEWVGKFGRDASPAPDGTGEVVVLCEAGLAPLKVPGGPLGILPALGPRPGLAAGVALVQGNRPLGSTQALNDVEDWARDTLAERETLLLAKRAAILAAQELVSRKVERRHGETTGWLLRTVLLSMEQPDLRCWRTLPRTFQALQARLPAGLHDLSLQPVDDRGLPAGPPLLFPATEVGAGKTLILIARTVE